MCREFLISSQASSQLSLTNLPPFSARSDDFSISYLQCFGKASHRDDPKELRDFFTLATIEGQDTGKQQNPG